MKEKTKKEKNTKGDFEKMTLTKNYEVSKIEFSILPIKAFLKKRAAADLSANNFFALRKRGIGESPQQAAYMGMYAQLARLSYTLLSAPFPSPF